MAIEATIIRSVEKPWGVSDTRQWADVTRGGPQIGELHFERSAEHSKPAALLLKVLLTSKDLSVQVHPDDAYAQAMGLPRGKTEAWYILNAAAGAKVSVGLNKSLSKDELRSAISDGSIAEHLAWRTVVPDDVILVPAGTIHTIGGGIVLVEIQQNSDTTFRISDPLHSRALDVEHAVAVARAEPAECQLRPERMSGQRSLLVATTHFVFERIELPPESEWRLHASQETWLYCLSGSASAGSYDLLAGGAVFAESADVELRVGANGVACLVAYPGSDGPYANLLSRQRREVGQTGSMQRVTHEHAGTERVQ